MSTLEPMVELAFVMAPARNLFFAELVEALGDELGRLGIETSVHEGRFPPPRQDLVYALVPPHEYFALTRDQPPVPEDALARTIAVCAEQPNTTHFRENATLLGSMGAAFDISRYAIADYRRQGRAVEHLQLGYTPRWDRRLRPQDPREIDVLFLGCATRRRNDALAAYADILWPYRNLILLSDNSRPNPEASASFTGGREKLELLARSRVVLNIHQGSSPYFEWLRATQAIASGCVMVSEHSPDLDPLRAGEHLVTGDIGSLGWLVERLLEDEDDRARLEQQAYERLRSALPLSASAEKIASQAEALARRPTPRADVPHFKAASSGPVRRREPPSGPPARRESDDTGPIRRALKDLTLRTEALSRRVDVLRDRLDGGGGARVEIAAATPAHASITPRVSVLLTLYNYAQHIEGALDSVASSDYRDWEVVLVDDASSDEGASRARDWMRSNPDVPVLLVSHTLNRGLPHARNTAVGLARGELCFVLDADNEVRPHCLSRLVDALDADPGAAFAYGMLQRFNARGTFGLMNYLPWEPDRLRNGNYIDAMALIRREVLEHYGGWSTEPRLHGWEDYELWCRMAEDQRRATFAREVVARYRSTGFSMLSLTGLSVVDARAIIIERCPRLMAGVTPVP